ncbi:MAG TPA: CARDB domain-containing protein [Verrucomicrobiota bacterium]|nr:CARDB domain-containing protein [Verrucomicrobiota bacterium]
MGPKLGLRGLSFLLLLLAVMTWAPAAQAGADTLETVDGVAVIEWTGGFDFEDSQDGHLAQQAIAQALFQTHQDAYDFIVFFTNFDFAMPIGEAAGEQYEAVGFYTSARNNVLGLGQELQDRSADYGSGGVLQGLITMGNVYRKASSPFDPGFGDTLDTLSHELLHRFAARVRFLKDGQPSDDLLGVKDSGGLRRVHWSFLLDSAGSTMLGNPWQDNGDGTYTSLPGRLYYNPLDLYLLGVLDRTEVPPMVLLENPEINRERLPAPYVTIAATPRVVTIDDIIAVEGERFPAAAQAQKEFRVAVVLVTRPGGYQGEEAAMVRSIMTHWVWWFSSLTDGRAQVVVDPVLIEDLATNPGTPDDPLEPRDTPPEVREGLAWLQAHQDAEGRWSDDALTAVRETQESVLALRAYPEADTSVERAEDWLVGRQLEGTDDLARAILAFPRADLRALALRDRLLGWQNDDGGWGLGAGFRSSPVDTALTLRALLAVGNGHPEVEALASGYLQQAQRPEGCWATADGVCSVEATAQVLLALDALADTSQTEAQAQAGATWLLGQQQIDGGYGLQLSTVYETALALLALKTRDVSGAPVTEAVDYLLERQAPDGSWFHEVHQTALAVAAIRVASVAPDLVADTAEISFQPAAVTVLPSLVTVDAVLRNRGLTEVPFARVSLHEGSLTPQGLIAEQIVSFPGDSAVPVSFQATIAEGRTYRFYVSVDLADEVAESNERNNTAIKLLTPERTHDFAFEAPELLAVPAEADFLEPVTFTARLRNSGGEQAFHVPVQLLRDDPLGAQVVATAYADLPANGSAELQLLWNADHQGAGQSFFAVVDPADAFVELSEDNNTSAMVLVTVREMAEPNLALDYRDLHLSPAPALEGGDAVLSARVVNNGGSATPATTVAFYDGEPVTGTFLGNADLGALEPGAETTVSVTWMDIPVAGDRLLTAVADPGDTISEYREEDNVAFATFHVRPLPDLVVSAGAISFLPASPAEGEPVTIQVLVQNAGEQAAADVRVEVREQGSLVGEAVLAEVPGLSQAEALIAYGPAAVAGPHAVRVEVDPGAAVRESDEANNAAERTFVVQSSDLWLSEVYISPDGDGVKDETQVSFRLEAPATVRLEISSLYGELYRTFEGEGLSQVTTGLVAWDGRDQRGVVVPDQAYWIEVRDTSDQLLAATQVVVDNNRSALTEALGSPFLLFAIPTCQLPAASVQWLPDGSGLVASVADDDDAVPDFPEGTYFVAVDGSETKRLSDRYWTDGAHPNYTYNQSVLGSSPLSDLVALALTTTSRSTGSFVSEQLWVVQRDGLGLRLVATFDSSRGLARISSASFSGNGTRLAYFVDRNDVWATELWAATVDGAQKTLLTPGTDTYSSEAVWWRPGSEELVYKLYDAQGGWRLILRAADGSERDLADSSAFPDYLSVNGWLDPNTLVGEWTGRIVLLDAAGVLAPVVLGVDLPGIQLGSVKVSPSGDRLAAYGSPSGSTDPSSIVVCERSGSCRVVQTLDPRPAGTLFGRSELRWSSNGRRLTYFDPFAELATPCLANGAAVVVDADDGGVSSFPVTQAVVICGTEPPGVGENLLLADPEWMADSATVLGQDSLGAFAIDVRTSKKVYLPISREGLPALMPIGLSQSPTLKHLAYGQTNAPESVCFVSGSQDTWTMGSALNLMADLRSRKVDGALELRGTAADLNFESYRLEYAREDAPEIWNLIAAPGEQPLVDGLFATWVPPGTGVYRVRLLVTDRAGNIGWDILRVNWGLDSAVADLYLSEEFFSPNGDGVKDRTDLHLEVLEPVHLEIHVQDEAGQVVRTLPRDFLSTGEGWVAWDGLDDQGVVVADGSYTVEVLGWTLPAVVDTEAPEASLALSGIFVSKDPRSPDRLAVVLAGYSDDDNAADWVVQSRDEGNPSEWAAFAHGSGRLCVSSGSACERVWTPLGLVPKAWPVSISMDHSIPGLVGQEYRLLASDRAGNSSTVQANPIEEKLIAFWAGPEGGSLVTVPTKREGDTFLTATLPAEQAQPGRHVLAGLETLAAPFVRLTVQAWIDGQWRDWAQTESPTDGSIDLTWDNSALAPEDVVAVRFEAEDLFGVVHTSNEVVFQSVLRLFAGCANGGWSLKGDVSSFEPIATLSVQAKSGADPRWPEWRDYKVWDVAGGEPLEYDEFGLIIVPSPPDVLTGIPYEVRLVEVGVFGNTYTSEPVVAPPECNQSGLGLLAETERLPAEECGQLAASLVEVKAELARNSVPRPGTQLESMAFYVRRDGHESLLGTVALAGGRQAQILVDTAGMPEGEYPVRAVLTFTIEGRGPYQVEMTTTLVVDRTLPLVSILEPTPGQRMCPQSVTVDGMPFKVVPLAWMDEGTPRPPKELIPLPLTELFYQSGVDVDEQGQWAKCSEPGSFAIESYLAGVHDQSWNVSVFAGVFTLKARTIDEVGNLACAFSQVELDASTEVEVSVDQELFSPNGDGNLDLTTIRYHTNEPTALTIEVFQLADDGRTVVQKVRTLLDGQPFAGGSGAVTWDGANEGAQRVPDGWYKVKASVQDDCGNPAEATALVRVDATPPAVAIESPADGSTVGLLVPVRGTASDIHFDQFELRVDELDLVVQGGTREVLHSLLGTWNTHGQIGTYTLRLTASDLAGNSAETTATVEVVASSGLISALEPVPVWFSPDQDGVQDQTELRFTLTSACDATLELLDGLGAPVRTVSLPGLPAGAQVFSWDGLTDGGTPAGQGDYVARLTATLSSNPAVSQVESTDLVLDVGDPQLALTSPVAGSCYSQALEVRGDVQDPHLSEYTAALVTGGASETLDQGGQARQDHLFASLDQLAEGEHTARLTARDLAGNAAELEVPFKVDRTPPTLRLDAPTPQQVVGGQQPAVSIVAALDEANPASLILRVGAGVDPATWTELLNQPALPAQPEVFVWQVGPDSGVPDGVHTLALELTDCAGQRVESRVQVVVDNTPPAVALTWPAEGGYLTAPASITGSVSDANLEEYRVEVAQGTCSGADRWTTLQTGSTDVASGPLATLAALGEDGPRCLRLVAEDLAGNQAEVRVNATVDTAPPGAPVLAGRLEGLSQASLDWTDQGEPDLAGFEVFRGGQKLHADLVEVHAFTDANLVEGWHEYTVKAVDRAGWRSPASNVVRLRVDLTPPAVALLKPAAGSRVSALVEVTGTASSADDFKEYRLSFGAGVAPAAWTAIRTSWVPVEFGLLGRWDTLLLPDGPYTLKLEAEDLAGNVGVTQSQVEVDNSPPSAPLLLSAVGTGSDVDLTWQGVVEPDVAGYLLYRNDQLANAPAGVVTDLFAFLLTGTAYHDAVLPDGTHTYYLVALDQAGNPSDPSNELQVTLETRAPVATIVEPADGHHFEETLLVRAECPDQDVASIQLEYRPDGSATWQALGSALASEPWVSYLDPQALSLTDGVYWLRAVAMDQGGLTDPAPTAISVVLTDVDAPPAPANLLAAVTADAVELRWDAVQAPDLDGYLVFETTGGGWAQLTPAPVQPTNHVLAAVADGTHSYQVLAQDLFGNQSAPSNTAEARVYAPALAQPWTPISEASVAVRGSQAAAGASVELFADPGTGPISQGSATADGEGAFSHTVALPPGEHALTAVATDGQGNVSRTSAAVWVTFNQPPAAPLDLAATTAGLGVNLTWSPVPEPDVLGYLVYRDGAKLQGLSAASGGTATASSNSYSAPNVLDGSSASYWASATMVGSPPTPQWLQIAFPSARLVRRVEIDWGTQILYYFPYLCAGKDFQVQGWTGRGWLDLATVTGNSSASNALDLERPYATSQLRVLITAPTRTDYQAHVRVLELRVKQDTLLASASFADSVPHDGVYTYTVTAVDSAAAEGPQSAPLEVPVGDVVAPAAPLDLVAVSSGRDIQLSWSTSPEPDLASYRVYRETPAGWLRLDAGGVTAPAYLDAGLPNGTFTYRVTAVDLKGNESEPSTPASASVAESLPGAPVLVSIESLPEGQSLRVCWQAGGDVSAVRLYRSLTAGVGYSSVLTAGPGPGCATDPGLVDGTTYYYVARTLDAFGNESLPSNELAGTPADGTAPAAPELFAPTVPGEPLSVAVGQVDLAGRAEPGVLVSVLRGGQVLGVVQALAADQVEQFTLTAVDDGLEAALAPDGRRLAYSAYQASAGRVQLWVRDLTGGSPTLLETGAEQPVWLPDGSLIAMRYVPQGAGNNRIGLVDPTTGTVTDLTLDSYPSESSPSFSADASRVAFLSSRSGPTDVWVLDRGTGAYTQVTQGTGPSEPRLSPDGRMVAFVEGTALRLMDLDSSVVQDVDPQLEQTWVLPSLAWSPDSGSLAFVSSVTGQPDLYLYDAVAGSSIPLTSTLGLEQGPVFSPDGQQLGFVTDEGQGRELRVLDLRNPGQARALEVELPLAVGSLDWARAGQLGLSYGDQFLRVEPAGAFRLPEVALLVGENLFSALATDGAGNASPASEPISVTLDSARLPDLAVQDLVVFPALPVAGEPATFGFTVRNIGGVEAPGASVQVLVLSGGSVELVLETGLETLPAGGELPLEATWDTTGRDGPAEVFVVVDPDDALLEADEDNNSATREFHVSGSQGLELLTSLDRASLAHDEWLAAEVLLANSGSEVEARLQILVEDAQGALVEPLLDEQLELVYGFTQSYFLPWNSGDTFPGAYQVRSVLTGTGGQVLAESAAPFEIRPTLDLALVASTDRQSYGTFERVDVQVALENLVESYVVPALDVVTTVRDPGGVVVFEQQDQVRDLTFDLPVRLHALWDTELNLAGVYLVDVSASVEGTVAAAAQTSFTLVPVVELSGAIAAVPQVAQPGTRVTGAWSVFSSGNAPSGPLAVRTSLVEPGTFTVLASQGAGGEVGPGATLEGQAGFDLAGLGYGTYLLTLSVDRGLGEEWLASASFMIVDTVGPAIAVLSPQEGGSYSTTVRVEALVRDDGQGVERVDFQVDGGPWIAMGPADPIRGRYLGFWTPQLGQEGPHVIHFRALDLAGNESRAAVAIVVENICHPVAEVCDGVDNDCDGSTDEQLGSTSCGLAGCTHTIQNCVNGQLQTCDPFEGAVAELCDLLDNDCDGSTDEELGSTTCGVGICVHTIENCVAGVSQTCNPLEGAVAETCNNADDDCDGSADEDLGQTTCGQGICLHSVDNCVAGVAQTCNPLEGALSESCNSLDDDCDGSTDEELGSTTCGLGACQHTVENCIAGVAQTCDPLAGAMAEGCNSLDDDCDGSTDEELGQTTCGAGVCVHTVQNCVNGQPVVCDPMEGAVAEGCDLQDNDCDGLVDEELGSTTCGQGVCLHSVDNCVAGVSQTCDPMDGALAESCNGLDDDCDGSEDEELGFTTCGTGVCVHTVENCVAGQVQDCDPFEGAVAEACDGLDNDCDSDLDEDLGSTSCGLGICAHTVQNCVAGATQTCNPLEGALSESCNSLDDDCDGSIDEEQGSTTCGVGICQHTVANCLNGQPQTCDPLAGALAESCNALDDDCDGSTDEELGTTTCGLGPCEHTVENCAGGAAQTCDPLAGASEELCDGLDNDCNGSVDDLDLDADGYLACVDDCDDSDPAVNPGATELVCDGQDDDCEPASPDDPDEDADGVSLCSGDCDDLDPDVHPGQPEIPGNGKDDDCDPSTPDGAGPGLPEFDQAVCTDEGLTLKQNARVASYDPYTMTEGDQALALTLGDLTLLNNAAISGDLMAWGNLLLKNNAYVTGDAAVHGSVTLKNNAWIGGVVSVLDTRPGPCDGGYDLAGALAWVAATNDNANLWADPTIEPYLTADGGLEVPADHVVVLPGGTYHLHHVMVGNNGSIEVAPGASVVLFLEGSLDLRNNAVLNHDASRPERFVILSGADSALGQTVVVRNNAALGLYLFAPLAVVELDNNAALHGGLVCRRLTLLNNMKVLQPAIELH